MIKKALYLQARRGRPLNEHVIADRDYVCVRCGSDVKDYLAVLARHEGAWDFTGTVWCTSCWRRVREVLLEEAKQVGGMRRA